MNLAARIPWRSLVVAAAALVVAATPGALAVLALDRTAVLAGELWRVATAHLVHLSSYHLTWDVAALVALGLLFEREIGRRFWSLLGCAACFVSIGVLFFAPDLEIYTGLSGVLNGLWVGGALTLARVEAERGGRRGNALRRLYLACVVVAIGKIAVESSISTPLFTDPVALGGVPVPLAHAFGALAGAVWTLREPPVRQASPGQPPARCDGRACHDRRPAPFRSALRAVGAEVRPPLRSTVTAAAKGEGSE